MANLIDITSNILSQNTICFDSRNINTEHITFPIQDAKFGILNFKAVTAEETSDELDFLFVVDCSGSMSDKCSDGRNKMQHITHTLKNMIMFFNEHPNIKINVTVNAFDTRIYKIIERTKITDENINEIIFKIEKIVPRGSTDIEFALKESNAEIARLQTEFPNNNINHIFMTDGEATDGSKDIEVLKSNINPNIINAFIGFGVEHDAALLNGISSVEKSSYYFIDKLESAGLVYGEILHGIVYKLLTESEINIENGLIYDFKTNTWCDKLAIGDIVSEANKIFNIISSHPEECKVQIKGKTADLIILFPSTLIETTDLSLQIYRQRTLQLLYEVNEFCKIKRDYDILNNTNVFFIRGSGVDNISTDLVEQQKILRIKMTEFMEEIKKYMQENDLTDNKILKNLCDDIYVCYRTFGTKFGIMYSTARQTSQGTQRVYTASHVAPDTTEDLYDNTNTTLRRLNARIGRPVLQRQTNAYNDNESNIQLPILQHELSDFADTPYLTPQATQIMREISGVAPMYIPEMDDASTCETELIN